MGTVPIEALLELKILAAADKTAASIAVTIMISFIIADKVFICVNVHIKLI